MNDNFYIICIDSPHYNRKYSLKKKLLPLDKKQTNLTPLKKFRFQMLTPSSRRSSPKRAPQSTKVSTSIGYQEEPLTSLEKVYEKYNMPLNSIPALYRLRKPSLVKGQSEQEQAIRAPVVHISVKPKPPIKKLLSKRNKSNNVPIKESLVEVDKRKLKLKSQEFIKQ